jgi:hypothetical protein
VLAQSCHLYDCNRPGSRLDAEESDTIVSLIQITIWFWYTFKVLTGLDKKEPGSPQGSRVTTRENDASFSSLFLLM